MQEKIFVTDFDGTMTKRDFYTCVVELLLQPEDLNPWHRYISGEISHFQALVAIFGKIRVDESSFAEVFARMDLEPRLKEAVELLRLANWRVVVVSNGCGWYLQQLLDQAEVALEVHTNPGRYSSAEGLVMEAPHESPFFSIDVGISKAAVVGDYIARGCRVAFAGDGPPDLEPALLVPCELRFARGQLAERLVACNQRFRGYESWFEVAQMLALC